MADAFASNATGLDSPARSAAEITAADTPLATATRGIYVGGAGSVKVTLVDGTVVTFTNVPAGSILPVRATQIWAVSSATGIVALS